MASRGLSLYSDVVTFSPRIRIPSLASDSGIATPSPSCGTSSQIATPPCNPAPQPPKVSCISYAVADASTGDVLLSKCASLPCQIASITKVMTAHVVLKLLQKELQSRGKEYSASQLMTEPVCEPSLLDEFVLISLEAASIQGTTADLRAGEIYTVRDLLHGMMLPSGNDAAAALAEYFGDMFELPAGVGRKVRDHPHARFVAEMNREAARLGLTTTRFGNAHGLSDSKQQSCAADVCKLASVAMSDPVFAAIVGTRSYTACVRANADKLSRLGKFNCPSQKRTYPLLSSWVNTNVLLGSTIRAAVSAPVPCPKKAKMSGGGEARVGAMTPTPLRLSSPLKASSSRLVTSLLASMSADKLARSPSSLSISVDDSVFSEDTVADSCGMKSLISGQLSTGLDRMSLDHLEDSRPSSAAASYTRPSPSPSPSFDDSEAVARRVASGRSRSGSRSGKGARSKSRGARVSRMGVSLPSLLPADGVTEAASLDSAGLKIKVLRKKKLCTRSAPSSPLCTPTPADESEGARRSSPSVDETLPAACADRQIVTVTRELCYLYDGVKTGITPVAGGCLCSTLRLVSMRHNVDEVVADAVDASFLPTFENPEHSPSIELPPSQVRKHSGKPDFADLIITVLGSENKTARFTDTQAVAAYAVRVLHSSHLYELSATR